MAQKKRKKKFSHKNNGEETPVFSIGESENTIAQSDHNSLPGLDSLFGPFPGTEKSATQLKALLLVEQAKKKKYSTAVSLLQQAIEIDSNCLEAYEVLGFISQKNEDKLHFFKLAIEAGRITFGEDFFNEFTGKFWLINETRPFMLCMEAYARLLWDAGRWKESVVFFLEMLKLNPNDNQGIRDELFFCLLTLKEYDSLNQLIKKYDTDYSASVLYAKTFLLYARPHSRPFAEDMLKKAISFNPHPFLIIESAAEERLPELTDFFRPGYYSEGVKVTHELLNYLYKDSNALTWFIQTASRLFEQNPQYILKANSTMD